MTKHIDRKSDARNIARLLNTNYTTGLRLAEASEDALEAKTESFPYEDLRPSGVWGIANPDPAFPQGVRAMPWDWHPEDGFTRGGSARTPVISSGTRIMSKTGMHADAAFILGTGIRSVKDMHIMPPKHPARAILEDLPFTRDGLDAQLFAELGFAARGTAWIMENDEAHTMVVREMAALMAALLLDTAACSPGNGDILARVANTIHAQLAATEPNEDDQDVQWVDDLGGRDFGGINRQLSNAGYSASALLLDLRKCGDVAPNYYASARRVGHFMSAVGPQRTRRFIEGMTDLFSALHLLGESNKQAA